MRKAASQIKLLHCFVEGQILENLTGRVIFSNFAGMLWIYEQVFFNMFGKFGRIFFQAALVGRFFREKNVTVNK